MHFHTEMYAIVDDFGFGRLNVPVALSNDWKLCISQEITLNNQAKAHVETSQLAAADDERDDVTVYLFSSVRSAALSPVAAIRQAGEALQIVIDAYPKLSTAPRDEQTGKTYGLLDDLNDSVNAAHITTLGLTDTVTLLREKNKAYQDLKDTLNKQKANASLSELKSVRRQTDAAYHQAADLIYATYLLTTDTTLRTDIEGLIDRMNTYIAGHKAAHKQSIAQRKLKPEDSPKPDVGPAPGPVTP